VPYIEPSLYVQCVCVHIFQTDLSVCKHRYMFLIYWSAHVSFPMKENYRRFLNSRVKARIKVPVTFFFSQLPISLSKVFVLSIFCACIDSQASSLHKRCLLPLLMAALRYWLRERRLSNRKKYVLSKTFQAE
jgi:hypothetical protein